MFAPLFHQPLSNLSFYIEIAWQPSRQQGTTVVQQVRLLGLPRFVSIYDLSGSGFERHIAEFVNQDRSGSGKR